MTPSRGRWACIAGAALLLTSACGIEGETDGGLRAGPEVFDCPTGLERWGERHAPPIEDLAEQQAIADRLARPRPISAWRVRHVAPSALGPVALVDGRTELAQETLPREAGRPVLVGRWSEPDPAAGNGLHGQVTEVVQWQLEPVLRELRAATRGVEGDAGLVVWDAAGAVVQQWRSPVPDRVARLAGVREDGVEVIVEPVTYSARDTTRAGRAVLDRLEQDGREWSTAYACSDGSGLVVGLPPPVRDRATLGEELRRTAGMPVLVRAEAQPVDMIGPR